MVDKNSFTDLLEFIRKIVSEVRIICLFLIKQYFVLWLNDSTIGIMWLTNSHSKSVSLISRIFTWLQAITFGPFLCQTLPNYWQMDTNRVKEVLFIRFCFCFGITFCLFIELENIFEFSLRQVFTDNEVNQLLSHFSINTPKNGNKMSFFINYEIPVSLQNIITNDSLDKYSMFSSFIEIFIEIQSYFDLQIQQNN